MDYYEFQCESALLSNETRDLLTAYLADIGFESFIDDENAFKAYIQCDIYDANILRSTIEPLEQIVGKLPYTVSQVVSENWNETWEQTFECAEINESIFIHIPTYVPAKPYKHDIIIQPRMAFGSGTHETTSLILQTMQTIDLQGKTVCDCGCGTGVLGIFASQLGASSVYAFDYDNNSVENTIQNAKLNNVENITVKHASFDCMQNCKFDLVLANINRNILVENMEYIAKSLNPNGIAILSGFYSEDASIVIGKAETFGLQIKTIQEKNNWTVTTFIQ
ncbi:MAG: 50S ribosomal protein L11 methyltransferase [Bacteroidales bacterium]|nr:50S ribosomal protein L11 methyltransferase [Bacteroidales bacterium]